MPVVPIAQNRVGIASVDGTKLVAPDLSGSGLQAVGAGLETLSKGIDEVHDVALRNQDIYDEAAVRQADNMLAAKVRDITLTGDGAFYKLSGSDAVGAAQPTTARLSAVNDEIKASLKNDAQRRMFGILADRRLEPEYDGIAKHSDTQLAVYNNDQSKARMALASDNAVSFAEDPERFADEMTRLGHEVDFQTKGMPAEQRQVEHLKAVSDVRTRIVDAKMTNDPVGAAAYYHTNIDDFTPEAKLAVEKALHGPMNEREGKAWADTAVAHVSGAGNAAPVTAAAAGGGSTLARMTAITLHAESGGRDYTNGRLTTSSAGAQAAMQTMPGTQRDPGFGVAPARDDSVAEMNRVGRDYLAAMVKRYGGDPAKAWAAYNGGPGRVDAAVSGHGAGWLGAMPAETQFYVHHNLAMLGGGRPPGEDGVGYAPRHDDLSKAYAFIQSQHLPFDVEQAAMAELDHRVARDDHLLVRQQDAAKDQAFTSIDQLGPKGFTSINQLSADVRRNLSPEVYHTLMDQAEQNAKPKAVPEHGEAVINLKELAALDPKKFMQTDLRLYQTKVSPAEYEDLSILKAKMVAKPDAPEAAAYSQIWKFADFYGRDVGIDMGPMKNTENAETFQARRQQGYALFNTMQGYLHLLTPDKPPTDAQMKAAYDNAVMPVRDSDGSWKPRFTMGISTPTSVAVPGPWHAAMREKLRAQGLPYDDRTIANVYLEKQRNAR